MTTFPLDRRTEIQIGGVWTDISTRVYERDLIKITRGAKNESGKTTPGSLTLTLNNRDGLFSPRNPMSPYYGRLGRATPIRVSVPGTESYLDLDGTTAGTASTPDTAALDITGDLDLRIEATADWYATEIQTLIGKWESLTAQRSYSLRLQEGTLVLNWSANGTTLFAVVFSLPTLPRRAALRVTLDVNNGAGGLTANAYSAPSLAGPWTQFDTYTDGAFTTSIYAGAAPLQVAPVAITGWPPARALIHRAEVRNGINGTVVADPDFRTRTDGTTSFVDTAGRTWTATGTARISTRAYRFVGEVSSWPTRWDTSGTDVYVPLEASGILRRLGQGRKPIASTLRRRIPTAGNLLAYWPMEEGAAATQASSPIPGVRPLQLSRVTWASATDLASSSPLPVLASAGGDLAQMSGTVPAPTGSPTGWQVRWVYRLNTVNATNYTFMRVLCSGGTHAEWFLQWGASGARVQARDSDGTTVLNQGIGTGLDLYNQWVSASLRVSQSGGTVTWTIQWIGVGTTGGSYTGTYAGTIGRVRSVSSPPDGYAAALDGMALGHLAVFSVTDTTAYSGAITAYDRETALNRMARLAEEETLLPLTWTDGDRAQPSEQMGPQRPAELLALLEDCAATDGGLLYERRDRLALHYRDRTGLYNQTPALTLTYTAPGEVAPGLDPVEDDQNVRNDVTVIRAGGSSGRYEVATGPLSTLPPEQGGVGTYDTSITLSLGADTQTEQIAAWQAHLGTVDEPRYPTVRVMLHAAPHLIPAALGLELGDLLTITNLPSWMPPGDARLMVRGLTETIGRHTWEIAYATAPARPWDVGVYDDPVRGRYDTGGTVLATAVTASAAALPVLTTDGTPWISSATHPSHFPFDVAVGGERATVTGITGVAEDQFGRTVASGWGAADSGQAWTTAGGSAADYSVTGGTGRHIMTTRNVFRHTLAAVPVPDVDLRVDVSVSALPVADNAYAFAAARYTDTTHMYFARIQITPAGAATLTLRVRNGGETQLGATIALGTYTPGAWYTVRLSAQGSTISASAWPRGSAEPATWQISVTDASLSAAGAVGCRSLLGSATTNPLPVTVQFDALVCAPQQMTVTRSANGIVKGHAAGTDVRLADPTHYAL
ncbi:hypothetical protein [uncultured Streptomyces sp.]|uniref:hypothetical protein n=1 Tax=uncultured Streptomyces sp. TaxID=174707 RepID=UPI00260DFE67|nr:hypothetical protein [uncultured Streptomyces sp.]